MCRRFHESSQSRAVRSRWLIQRYGRGKCLEQARFYPWFSDALVVSLMRSGVTLLRRGDADAGSDVHDVIKTSATLRWLAREGLVRSVEAVLAMQGVVHVPVPDDRVDGLSSAHLGEVVRAEGYLFRAYHYAAHRI